MQAQGADIDGKVLGEIGELDNRPIGRDELNAEIGKALQDNLVNCPEIEHHLQRWELCVMSRSTLTKSTSNAAPLKSNKMSVFVRSLIATGPDSEDANEVSLTLVCGAANKPQTSAMRAAL